MRFPEGLQALSGGAWVALLVTAWVLWVSWRFNLRGSFQAYVYDKRGTRLPGPINTWPFGFVWTVREWRRQNIWWIKSKELFDTHGPIIGFRVFSSYSILTADPECVRAIVTGSADLFPKGHLYKHLGLLPGGLFTTNGPRWRRDRRLLNPHFNFSAVATYVPGFNAHVDEFLGGLKGRCGNNRRRVGGEGGGGGAGADMGEKGGREEGVVVDMVQGFNRLTLDIIFDAGFGHDLHAVRQVRYRPARASDTGLVPPSSHSCRSPSVPKEEEDSSSSSSSSSRMQRLVEDTKDEGDVIAEALRIAFTEVAKRLTDPLPCFKYLPRRYNQAKGATRVLRAVIDKAINERRKRAEDREAGREGGMEETRGNLLDLMMAVHEEGAWCTQELLAHSMTLLVAGHETTSAMLTWTLMELGERPDLLQRLRAESDEVCGPFHPSSTSSSPSSAIDATHVERMPFLRSVLKESLRMHPPVTMFSRRTLKDLDLGGYLIPKGWHVGVSVYTLHRSPALWERPDEFWPDRWAEGQEPAKGGREGGSERVRAVSLGGGGAGLSPLRTPSSVHRAAAAAATPEGGAPATFLTSPKQASTPTTSSSSSNSSNSSSSHNRRASTSSIPAPLPKGPLKSPFQYVPFSLGPRNCIGQRFGVMEASIILARLLREWDVTLLDRAATVQRLELLTVRPDRLLCKLTPRKVVPAATAAAFSFWSPSFWGEGGMTGGGNRDAAEACIP